MANVLFSSTFFYKLDPKQWGFHQPYPPLGTLLAAAVIRRENINVSFFDASFSSDPEEITAPLEKEKPEYVVIFDDGFNYLTKMCLTVMREAVFVMARKANERGCTVMVCSSDATDHCEQYFDHGVRYVIRGEGEETLRELLLALDKNNSVEQIKGLAFRKEHKTIVTPDRPVMRDLDALPMPAWDLVSLEEYRKIWLKHHGYGPPHRRHRQAARLSRQHAEKPRPPRRPRPFAAHPAGADPEGR
ncbi:MAG TPA: hypothetical protein PLR06_13310, partial [Cyclobacteriaceae bacterium]|nr:hypothetical protein [Cyclobacteriaceae bacterium]